MGVKNNVSAYIPDEKKDIIKRSQYTFRDAIEVSAFLIERDEFTKIYKEMQIADLQKDIDEINNKKSSN